MMDEASKPVGIFDSGVGGLTVYRALRARLPHERFIYFGDMGRVPYGTKSPETVARYTMQIARHLQGQGIKMLVVACNTATALGLPQVHAELPDLPAMGVIEAGARAAVQASRRGRILVLATEGTIRSQAYQAAIQTLRPDAQVTGLACGLLVGLAEEGWTDGPEVEAVLRRYLGQVPLADFDVVVLGCTHFPLLAPAIRRLLPHDVALVDSAETTACAVEGFLAEKGLLGVRSGVRSDLFQVSDFPERFHRLAALFLQGQEVAAQIVRPR